MTVDTGSVWTGSGAWLDAGGHDHLVEVVQVVGRRANSHVCLDVSQVEHVLVVADRLDELLLAGDLRGQLELPTDLARRLEQFDPVAASGELDRGLTLVGPHRDDLVLGLGPMPAKGYASHGESWSLALALRLGSFELLRADGIEPVLVLDDVFAELDSTRRDRLAGSIVDADQVLVTTAVASDVPEVLHGARFDVGGGNVMAHEEVLDER